MTAADRETLRATFETAALRYDAARPRYPAELIDDVMELTGLVAGDRVLEVGCGTGIATRALAERGLDVTCIEMGSQLAEVARTNLAGLAAVRVQTGSFEEWRGPGGFDAVVAATSWHWIDPATKHAMAARQLRPGGHLAFWSAVHVFPDGGDPFFAEIQEVYQEIGEGMDPEEGFPRPGELLDQRSEIEASGVFAVVATHHHDWEITYTAEAYIALLDTFSTHILMTNQQRDRLYGEIRRRVGDGTVRRHWGAVLHVARKFSLDS